MMQKFKKISHVIFDMDGVLLDTEPLYTKITQVIVGRYGKTFEWPLKAEMMGRTETDSARILVEALNLPIEPKEFLRQKNELIKDLFPTAQALPGAQALTKHLYKHNIPQAIASSSQAHFFKLKTSRHQQWFSLFNRIVLGDDEDVKRGKPAPDIFLVAVKHLGAQPEQCLVFEDSPAGVQAGLAAKMNVVAVPDVRMDRTLFKDCDQVLNSLTEFVPEAWGLPPTVLSGDELAFRHA